MNREPRTRIISIVPSLTETLCDFGMLQNLVGCTNFCIEPKSLRTQVESVGGTKDADLEKIVALNPTHIVVNTEENTSALISKLREIATEKQFEVIETFLDKPEDNFTTIKTLSEVFLFQNAAEKWCRETEEKLRQLTKKRDSEFKFTYIYFIWMNPWMVAGNQTYISRCLELIGGENQIVTGNNLKDRYPILNLEILKQRSPKVCLFSSEPFPFRARHIDKFEHEVQIKLPNLKVDGQALSWYGSRFTKTISYLEILREKINKI
ncbi:MAG: hypothetical protein RJB13_315 [Pseudomonadota bacterium]